MSRAAHARRESIYELHPFSTAAASCRYQALVGTSRMYASSSFANGLSSLFSGLSRWKEADDGRRTKFVTHTREVLERQPHAVRAQLLLQKMDIRAQAMRISGYVIAPNRAENLFLREELFLMSDKTVQQLEFEVRQPYRLFLYERILEAAIDLQWTNHDLLAERGVSIRMDPVYPYCR